jgi:hypothetical protein
MNSKSLCLTLGIATLGHAALAEGWIDHAIAPVANPIYFETPLIQSEVRPLFAYHRLDAGLLGVGGDVKVYAVQLRYAITDRLALIATKDGYTQIHLDNGTKLDGWNDLAAGLKYALIQNDASQLVVTPGFTVTLPTGNEEVFQGTGKGRVDLFVSALKGFGDFHITGNVGGTIPFNFDQNTANLRFNALADYYVCNWFIPFVGYNSFLTVSEGNAIGLPSEGFDVINFGSSNASGHLQGTIGLGFRSRITSSLDFGAAYEFGVIDTKDIFKDRLTVDLVWRF